jgi:hypothetical protein
MYSGLAGDGPLPAVRIDSLNPEADYYEPVITVSFGAGRQVPRAALITSDPSLAFAVVPFVVGELDADVDQLLKQRFHVLWMRAIAERDAEDSTARYSFGEPVVHQIGDLRTIRYPIVIDWNQTYRDDRGSAFFIYSSNQRTIIYAAIGHPEWAPSNGDVVLDVEPYFYFQIVGDSTVYFIGNHERGWEDEGVAIYELRTGRVVLEGD